MVSDDPRLKLLGDQIEILTPQYLARGWSLERALADVANRVRSNTLAARVPNPGDSDE